MPRAKKKSKPSTCTAEMLAESRRKQKWSRDPNNTAWTQGARGAARWVWVGMWPSVTEPALSPDKDKFGLKIMEKMGWEDGKGLGRNLDGSVSHIGVRLKKDNRGAGGPGAGCAGGGGHAP